MCIDFIRPHFGRLLWASASAVAAVALMLGPARDAAAQAAVTVIGDLSPVDLPFVPGDQGLPAGGNTVITAGVNGMGNPIDGNGDLLRDGDMGMGNIVGQFNFERSANIEVGRFSPGDLLLNGGAVLRFGDLIIGGSTDAATFNEPSNLSNNGQFTNFGDGSASAVGTVQIVGVGSIYNNHSLIIPTQFQDTGDPNVPGDGDPEATSFMIPDTFDPGPPLGGLLGTSDQISNIRRDPNDQFDLYVGLTGTGHLAILDGGRAEIRDGAFLGVAPGAVGRVEVDGTGSYLGIYGGMRPAALGGPADAHTGEETLIGVFGEGTLEITNGGRVDSFNRAALGASNADGEEVGGIQDRGGNGFVTVDGRGSVWRIFTEGGNQDEGSALAIGEYFNEGDDMTRIDLLLSDPIAYTTGSGAGQVTISNGGLVDIRQTRANAGSPNPEDEEASVRIGRFGVLELNGGKIVIGDRLDNDGLIRTGDTMGGDNFGDGEIDTGTFLNSPLGFVRVRAGEYLRLRSRSVVNGLMPEMFTAGDTTVNYFYANAGKIEVLGDQALGKAEAEFDREFDPEENNTVNDDRFRNLQLVNVPSSDPLNPMVTVRGQIKAQDANLFFRSGLLNDGDLLFVGGDNVVTGPVENSISGLIAITNDSHVIFQDPVVSNGEIVLSDGAQLTLAAGATGANPITFFDTNTGATVFGTFTLNDAINFVISDTDGAGELNATLDIVGDATFGPLASLGIAALSLTDIADGDSFQLIDVGAGTVVDAGAAGIGFDVLPVLPGSLVFVPDLDLTDGYTLTVADLNTLFPFVPIGGDFNGDNIVDAADLAIFNMNFGLSAGATANLGDADGDGDVDQADGAILAAQFGMVPMAPVLFGGVSVPEPSAALLMLAAGVFAAAGRRRC